VHEVVLEDRAAPEKSAQHLCHHSTADGIDAETVSPIFSARYEFTHANVSTARRRAAPRAA